MIPEHPHPEIVRLREEVAKLRRMNVSLMDRVERTTDSTGNAYAIFESNIIMQDTIRERTSELARANTRLQQEVEERKRAEERMRKARDEARSADAAKSEFLANMSHEIRTPMTAILGYAELLDSEDQTRASVSDVIHSIRCNAAHLLGIINDVLDMSKIESGNMPVHMSAVDPSSVTSEVIAMITPSAAAKNLAVAVHWPSGTPPRISSDATKLRQILLNLIGNAIKFTDRGSIEIEASYSDKQRCLCFVVRDTGIGMTEDQCERIARFEPFAQADTSMARRHGGTGLGLSIAASMARLLGGTIAIESAPGVGSSFTITLPAAPADIRAVARNEPKARKSKQASTEPPLQGRQVLLAEDGPDNQKLLALHLRKAGAQVVLCENGRIALDAVLTCSPEGRPDLVLMDMQMPEMDGYEATARLREHGCRLPIIAVTAHAMKGDRERCLSSGCDDYITKPLTGEQLISLCTRWLDRRGGLADERAV